MQCECRKEIEARLLARFKEQNPSSANHKVRLTGYTMLFGSDHLEERAAGLFIANHDVTAKNGNVRNRRIEQSMLFNYCPFCGKSATKQEVSHG